MDTAVASHWLLDPSITFLNHGSFGACPVPVLEAQAGWRERMERDPVRFLATDLPGELEAAREALGAFLSADPEDLAFVANATSGVNTVLRSVAATLSPGDELLATDHEYNATLNALRFVAEATGARVRIAHIPLPIESPDQVVDAVVGAASARTRVALVSHATSATALIFPIERVVSALAERGIETLVDAAHSPGMVPLDIGRLGSSGAAWVTGNGHKWLCGPKGVGFLWARRDRQAGIRPLVISHGANAPLRGRSSFRAEADWTGTADPSPALSLPVALAFMATLSQEGWSGVMAANHALVLAARDLVDDALGLAALAPREMLGAMAALSVPLDMPPMPSSPLSADPDETMPEDPLHDDLLARDGIQVPVYTWPPTPGADRHHRLLRLSAQRYNDLDDYRRLATALAVRRDRAAL